MERLSGPLRIAIVLGAMLCVLGGWLAWKIHHQMTTPIGVLVVQEGR